MDDLFIEGNQFNPTVNFCYNTGIMQLSGKSYPENVDEFYAPVWEWIEADLIAPQVATTIDVSLEYLNTASAKMLLDILIKVKNLQSAGNELKLVWKYYEDDEDMEDFADHIRTVTGLNVLTEIIPE